jgi:hypothetical protein
MAKRAAHAVHSEDADAAVTEFATEDPPLSRDCEDLRLG